VKVTNFVQFTLNFEQSGKNLYIVLGRLEKLISYLIFHNFRST